MGGGTIRGGSQGLEGRRRMKPAAPKRWKKVAGRALVLLPRKTETTALLVAKRIEHLSFSCRRR